MGYTAVAIVFTPCMIIYSLAYGGLASLQEPIRADISARRLLPQSSVVEASPRRALSWARSSPISLRSDQSYTLAFAIFAVVSLASAFCMFLAKPPARQNWTDGVLQILACPNPNAPLLQSSKILTVSGEKG